MEDLPTNVRLFLEYDYPVTRDIMGAFLTLVSGTLVFSVTFSDKITKSHEADHGVRRLMFAGWSAFFLALLLAGMALVMIVAAAGCVLYGSMPFLQDCRGIVLALGSWSFALLGGLAYAGGLLCLTLAAYRAMTPRTL